MKVIPLSSTRTNNFAESSIQKIQDVWAEAVTKEEFFKNDIYAVYHDYESNYHGDYTLSVCVPTNSEFDNIIDIDTNVEYEIFPVESTETGLYEAWQKIWDMEKNGALNRAYDLDYELHKLNGQVEIYIRLI